MKAEKERWAAVSLMKLHGKNILKCISNNVVSQRRSLKEFRMHCYAFVMLYLKDGPLRRSSECIAMLS